MNEEQIEKLQKTTGARLEETHISWLFLDGESVYKIKKPANFSFLDFSTLEKRKFYCEEEVRLNKRLCKDLYLGVVEINEHDGRLSFGGSGSVLDYAVKMRQLPDEKRMDLLLKKGEVGRSHIEEIAGIVADFHKRIDVISDKKYASAGVVKRQIGDLADFADTIEKACGMGEPARSVVAACDSFIEKNRGVFEKRQESGKIRDCHGDLHSANIFLADRIYIFDCIEFNRDFRFIDLSSEIAFMSMDLDAFGRKDFSELFVKTYVEKSGEDIEELLMLYKCYRANVRAKVAAIDYSQHPSEESAERIKHYLLLAEEYSKQL